MDSKFDLLIFDILVNQPELAKKFLKGKKNDKKSKKK